MQTIFKGEGSSNSVLHVSGICMSIRKGVASSIDYNITLDIKYEHTLSVQK